MAKYYKFHYSIGYTVTDTGEVFEFDDVSENEAREVFDDWPEKQRSDCGNFLKISKEEAEDLGIDEDLTE